MRKKGAARKAVFSRFLTRKRRPIRGSKESFRAVAAARKKACTVVFLHFQEKIKKKETKRESWPWRKVAFVGVILKKRRVIIESTSHCIVSFLDIKRRGRKSADKVLISKKIRFAMRGEKAKRGIKKNICPGKKRGGSTQFSS